MRANLYIVATSCNQSSVAVLLTCNSVAQCYTYCNPQSFAFVEFFYQSFQFGNFAEFWITTAVVYSGKS